MKTFILASLLALTAVSGVVVASQPAAAGLIRAGQLAPAPKRCNIAGCAASQGRRRHRCAAAKLTN